MPVILSDDEYDEFLDTMRGYSFRYRPEAQGLPGTVQLGRAEPGFPEGLDAIRRRFGNLRDTAASAPAPVAGQGRGLDIDLGLGSRPLPPTLPPGPLATRRGAPPGRLPIGETTRTTGRAGDLPGGLRGPIPGPSGSPFTYAPQGTHFTYGPFLDTPMAGAMAEGPLYPGRAAPYMAPIARPMLVPDEIPGGYGYGDGGGGYGGEPGGYGGGPLRGTPAPAVRSRAGGTPAIERVQRATGQRGPSGRGPGPRQYGVMAQDLERSRIGASLVRNTPYGKMVDTQAMVPALGGAMARLNERLSNIEATLGGAQGGKKKKSGVLSKIQGGIGLAGTIAGLAGLFSDQRLKEDIRPTRPERLPVTPATPAVPGTEPGMRATPAIPASPALAHRRRPPPRY